MNTYYIGGMPVTDELYHHGILGQKWGVRRFQNSDGSLTPTGKARYTQKILAKENKKLNSQNEILSKVHNSYTEKRIKKNSENIEKNNRALQNYSVMNVDKQKQIDRIMRIRNIGNDSFKRNLAGPLTQKYIDAELYLNRKDKREYIKGYTRAALSITIPVVYLMTLPRIYKRLTKW